MSPVVKKKRKKITITSQQLLLVLTAVCAFLLIFTFNTNVFEGVLKQAAGYVVVPFQNGIATIGGYLSDRSDELAQLKDVLALNKDLQEQIDQLTIENNQLQQDRYELNNLRSLYELDQAYSDYDKIGARVISSETDNWFSSFTINKGEEEGVQVDYNVMAGSGLVGRVVSVGPHYAKVISTLKYLSEHLKDYEQRQRNRPCNLKQLNRIRQPAVHTVGRNDPVFPAFRSGQQRISRR